MVVDERTRHALYLELEDILGPEKATTLMEHLPPVGWADVATKADLATLGRELRGELRGSIGELRGEIVAAEARVRLDIARQTRTLVYANLGAVVSAGALVLAAARVG